MKHCPSCDEILGASAETCFKCRYVFEDAKRSPKPSTPSSKSSRWLCPACGLTNYYPQKICQSCKALLKPQYVSASSAKNDGKKDKLRPPPIWLFVVGILIPIVGVPLGIKYVFQQRERSLIFVVLSFLGFLITPLLFMILFTIVLFFSQLL